MSKTVTSSPRTDRQTNRARNEYKRTQELRRAWKDCSGRKYTNDYILYHTNQSREREKERNTLFKFLGIYFLIENTSDVFLYIQYVIIFFVNSFQFIENVMEFSISIYTDIMYSQLITPAEIVNTESKQQNIVMK